MGSRLNCCVPNCGKSRTDDIVLHAFPDPEREEERFQAWKNAVGWCVSSLDHSYIFKNRRICHDHFERQYLTWTRRLTHDAVPTLHMPGNQAENVVMRDITNIAAPASHFEPTAASTSGQKENVVMRDSTNIVAPSSYVELKAVSTSAGATPVVIPDHPTRMKVNAVKQSTKSKQKGATFLDDKKALLQSLKNAMKKKDNYATRLKKALKLSENATFLNALKKFTSIAAIFMAMQFREISKKKMGRRFTIKEKIMALSIYKQGPRCYRMLNKLFILPSPLTLTRLIRLADLRAGINEKLFDVMRKKLRNQNTDDKLCILMFDEIAITPHFEYNQRKDQISGFITNGTTSENKIADHALVFMIRGISRNYKQPIAYTFCSGSTKKEELSMLITAVIQKLHSVGLHVLATVCDQGASNVSCINYMIAQTKVKYQRKNEEFKRDIFEIDDKEIIPLFDTPHLIKGIRNNLLDKNLKCKINGIIKTAKWEHVIKLHQENPSYSGIKLVKNLTEDHVHPEKCKMKVKFATQIFSQRVASTMGYLADKNILPEECRQTADILLFFDELFDSLNGSRENSKKRSGKPLLRAVTPTSSHNNIWAKAKTVLSTMKFVKNNKETTVPSISNWLRTVNNMEYLRDVLFKKYEIKSIWMRHFNQDPLENFFGAIRSHGCRNINPTPAGFEIAFASLLLNNLTGTHSPGSNCEQDSCKKMFKSMKELFKISKTDNTPQNVDLSYMQSKIFVDFEIKKKDPRILAQLEYVTGYLLRKTKRHVFRNCVSCQQNFCNEQKDNEYLKVREFDKSKQYLAYPKKDLVKMFSEIQDVLMWILKNQSLSTNIKNFAKTILFIEVNTNFITCSDHSKKNIEYMFDLGCRFFIYNWCKDVNNILKGRSRDAVEVDSTKKLALEYVSKRRKIK